MSNVEARLSGLARVAGPLALAVAFCSLAAWSWAKWMDVHIDFGNELYIPWQITEGKALYRDMAHRNGPLPPYVNALWFTLFGVSVRTLVWCNLAILVAIVAMTWRVFVISCSRSTATVTCGVLLGVFAFGQYAPIANYNYVTPYHHHQTHGIALTLAMMLALLKALGPRPALWLGVAGVALGGVFLTKAELFVPAALVAALGVAGVLTGVRVSRSAGAVAALAAFGAGSLTPPLLAFLGLVAQMPAPLALEGVLGNWAHLGNGVGGGLAGGILSDAFYARGAGLDDPGHHLWQMALACGGVGAFAFASGLFDHDLPRAARRPWVLAPLGVFVFYFLGWMLDAPRWAAVARSLPLAAALGAAGLGLLSWRSRADREALARTGLLTLWAVWGLALLAKTGLAPRFHQYGFALSMPATLLLVAGLVHGLPRFAAARWDGGGLARAMGLAAVAAGLLNFVWISHTAYQLKTQRVGEGADAIWTKRPPGHLRGAMISRALVHLGEWMGPADTLLVLPEGISLNYWLRKENPTRFHLFLPTELDAFGRDQILAAVKARPPDWIALVQRFSHEFGVGPFGEDPKNGQALMAWVGENYTEVKQIGRRPFASQRFGIVLLRRGAEEAASSR